MHMLCVCRLFKFFCRCVCVSSFNEWFSHSNESTRYTQCNSFHAGKFVGVRGDNNHGYDSSIRMEWIVHIVYHSFLFGITKFIHIFVAAVAVAMACTATETTQNSHTHTMPKIFLRASEHWDHFMNEFLSRFSRQRTKYRLTYISVMSLFVHCWACSCTSSSPVSFDDYTYKHTHINKRFHSYYYILFYLVFRCCFIIRCPFYLNNFLALCFFPSLFSCYIETIIWHSFTYVSLLAGKILRKPWMKLKYFTFHCSSIDR